MADDPKKTVVRSKSNKYKTITKGDDTKIKRTLKGILTGATPVKKTEANRADYISTAQKQNIKAAERISGKYYKDSGGNSNGAKEVYNKIANQEIVIPKDNPKYGDYKKGGTVLKGSKLRRQSSISGLRTSKKHK